MSSNKEVHLLDNLEGLLKKQIELARQGDVGSVEAMGRRAIINSKILLGSEYMLFKQFFCLAMIPRSAPDA